MPVAAGGAQMINNNGASIVFMDFTGRRAPQRLMTSGGGVNTDADKDLAEAIAGVSNAFLLSYGKDEKNVWRESDAVFYDEAHSNAETQLVITWVHDTDPTQSRELIIPAPRREIFLDDEITPDFAHAGLADVISKAQGVINDDGIILDAGDFHTYRARLTTRKVGKPRAQALNLPDPVEP